MDDRDWVLIDVETAGLSSPVVVELAAQRMRGWTPQGPAWRRLLNHGPDMNQESSRVHGLSRALIERDGEAPAQVYREWADYIDGLPLVAFDLPQALHRALQPEWVRLGIAPIGTEGFCALRLAQRRDRQGHPRCRRPSLIQRRKRARRARSQKRRRRARPTWPTTRRTSSSRTGRACVAAPAPSPR